MKKWLLILVCLMLAAPLVIAQDAPWWQETVWYEIFVRSFYDSDGDGIGDLQGVIQKLDYLNDGDPATTDDLGVTGIWLMPIMESPSYHGYDVTDYFAIEPDYGTEEDFLALMDAAHERGIRVIVDMVFNHTSSQHEWFQASAAGEAAFADWYVWADEDPGYRGPWNAQAWYPKGDRFYYAPFWSEMPDLNYENPAVTDEMFDVVDFWLTEMGVDGFRLDAIKYVVEDEINGNMILQDSPANRQWLAIMNEYIHRINPDAITVGEIWDATLVVERYMKDNSVDVAFAFDLQGRAINAARVGSRRDWEKELANLTNDFGIRFAPFLSNHDQNRLFNSLDRNIEANKAAASLLLTVPGTPFLYYGEEIGMTGLKAPTTDEPIRTPMQWDESENAGFTTGTPWTAVNADFADFNVAEQSADSNSLLSHYRALVQLRNAHPALRSEKVQVINIPLGAVTAYLRWTDAEKLLVVVNTGDEAVSDYDLGMRESPLAGITSAEVVFGEGEVSAPQVDNEGGFDDYQPLPELAPYSTLIISLS